MKIMELFASVVQKVNQNANKKISRKHASSSLIDKFIHYERFLSWQYLKLLLNEDILEKNCTLENLQPFFNFLAKRWERIHHIYQLSYTYNYKDELTYACHMLAVKLAEFQSDEIHPLKILMPSLETYNENLMMDLIEIDSLATKDEKIQLHHFIVDHWGYIININDCLKYASYSVSETILLHTSAQSKVEPQEEKSTSPNLPQVRVLEDKDKIRVSYHSKEAFAVISSINELVKEMNTLYNAADAIDTLVGYLHKGGVRGGHDGSELNSGHYSYIGIRKFYDFAKKLSPDDYSSLMAASAIYNTHSISFKHIWMHLLASSLYHPECNFSVEETNEILCLIRPTFMAWSRATQNTREILCADQYSIKLSEIKGLNVYLCNLRVDKSKADNKNLLSVLDNSYKQALARFENAILNNALTHFSIKEIEDFPLGVRKALKDEIALPEFGKRLASTSNDFAELLCVLPEDMHVILIQNLGVPFLKNIIASARQLIEIFQKISTLNNNQKKSIHALILKSLTKEYLREIILSKKTSMALSKLLTTDLYMEFIPQGIPPPPKYNLSFLNLWRHKSEIKSEIKCSNTASKEYQLLK